MRHVLLSLFVMGLSSAAFAQSFADLLASAGSPQSCEPQPLRVYANEDGSMRLSRDLYPGEERRMG